MTDRAKIGRRSRQKGATFERWVANQLKAVWPEARRQPQSQIKQMKDIAAHDPRFRPCLTDVVAGPFGIECKHRKVLPNMDDTLEQALDDVGCSGQIPVGVHKPNGGSAYDITVAILYHGDVMRMGWPEFLARCEKVKAAMDASSNPRGLVAIAQFFDIFQPRAD